MHMQFLEDAGPVDEKLWKERLFHASFPRSQQNQMDSTWSEESIF